MSRSAHVASNYANLLHDSESTVEIRISCASLVSSNMTKLPSAMVVVTARGQQERQWNEIGRTEVIKNCINPEFSTTFQLQYRFEDSQNVQFRVYEGSQPHLTDEFFLGGLHCTLGQMVAMAPYTNKLQFDNGAFAGDGSIKIFLEELTGNKETFLFKFSARGLDKKDVFTMSDPFLEIHKRLNQKSLEMLHRTEVKRNTLNPSWLPFNLAERILRNSNKEDDVKLVIWDYDKNGTHDLIGEVDVPLKELLKASNNPVEWPIARKHGGKKSSHKDAGKLTLEYCRITPDYTFLDYIFSGLQICFTVGIDFTASNGSLGHPKSLHYHSEKKLNEYEEAISLVGSVIQDYDSDKMFLALGFGARVPPEMNISYCFPLNLNDEKPLCAGVEGILEAYKKCLTEVKANGPTIVAPIINHVRQMAEKAHQQQDKLTNYHVLLLITDGAFTDMDDVQSAIVRSSHLPMSIIIVGVGNGDFGGMTVLDCDNGNTPLTDVATGDCCVRDIVHFVPFRKYQKAPVGILTRQVLAEVPRQITDYFKTLNDKLPHQRQQRIPRGSKS